MEIAADPYLIRSWQPEDATSLADYFSNPSVTKHLAARTPRVYSEAHAKAWIDLCALEADPVNFAIVSRGEAIGGIGLTLQHGTRSKSAEIGFWIAERFWGQGIASAVVPAFADYAFQQFDLLRLVGYVFAGNAASVRVLEKAGFTYEGTLRKSIVKDGEAIDELVYARVQ